MDPSALTTDQWAAIGAALKLLWLWVPLIVVFAFSWLLAVAVVPSLVTSRHLPAQSLRLRPLLLLVGLASLVGAVAVGALGLLTAGVLNQFYPRWLI